MLINKSDFKRVSRKKYNGKLMYPKKECCIVYIPGKNGWGSHSGELRIYAYLYDDNPDVVSIDFHYHHFTDKGWERWRGHGEDRPCIKTDITLSLPFKMFNLWVREQIRVFNILAAENGTTLAENLQVYKEHSYGMSRIRITTPDEYDLFTGRTPPPAPLLASY